MLPRIPEWATVVVSRIERHEDGISYSVDLEDEGDGYDGGRRLPVWDQKVFFGAAKATGAGGIAFVSMAQQQSRIADAYAEAIRTEKQEVAL